MTNEHEPVAPGTEAPKKEDVASPSTTTLLSTPVESTAAPASETISPPPPLPPTPPAPAESAKVEHKSGTIALGILSYLGILLVIPFLVSRNDPFVRFHLKQGMVLLVIEVILWILSGMFYGLISLINLLELGVIILAIIGIVNVLQRKEKELPLVGSFSKQLDPLFNAV